MMKALSCSFVAFLDEFKRPEPWIFAALVGLPLLIGIIMAGQVA